MQTLITGIRPSASLTIANLIGSVVPLLELQNLSDTDVRVFVATMHGLTDHEPHEVVPNVPEIVRDYLALGLDPAKVTIFDQRAIRSEVALLKLYLERHITVARACRVPALKDKLREGQNPEEATVLLMGYPVMMAADIVLQDADVVPVGKDQYSHLEVTRELVDTFNKKYGTEKKPVLVRPQTLNRDDPVNILALTGEGKMSKSKPETAVFLTDDESVIRKKIKRAETAFEGEMSEQLQSLVHVAHALAPTRTKEVDEVVARHMAGEKVMGTFKQLVADVVADFAKDFQEKRATITDAAVTEILDSGADVAQKSARVVLARVEAALGIDA
jgi:tryptophanyl-tRNA synthetase